MEPLKNMYSEAFIEKITNKIVALDGSLNVNEIRNAIYSTDWDALKLKERSTRIVEVLYQVWTDIPFDVVVTRLISIQSEENQLVYMFLPEYIGRYGLSSIDTSLAALEILTAGSTAEFAIRFFLQTNPQVTIGQMKKWTQAEDEHVRRLASEGLRTRLPWAIKVEALHQFIPEILDVLNILRHDPSLYVRKSVANNLNDLSKDYPEEVLELVTNWKAEDDEALNWIIKRGLRTLLKNGNEKAQQLLGYDNNIEVLKASLVVDKPIVKLSELSELSYAINLKTTNSAKVRLQYEITYVKKHGLSAKRFFLEEKMIATADKKISGTKKHHWRELTTRKHYPGIHKITLIVNGECIAETLIDLQIETK